MKALSLLSTLGLIVLIATGCGSTQATQRTTATASWAFNGINWNHRIYKITRQTVQHVGKQVTSVTTFSQDETTPETGTFSNYFAVGTKIFAIPGTDDTKAIAVEKSDGTYVKAILDHSY